MPTYTHKNGEVYVQHMYSLLYTDQQCTAHVHSYVHRPQQMYSLMYTDQQ